MGKGCTTEGCENEHHSSGSCKIHYRMPSQKNPKPIRRTAIAVAFSPVSFASKPAPKARVKSKKPKQDTIPTLIKKAEKVFNAWIRKRDGGTDGTFKCISCDLWRSSKEMDAGHYFSVRFSILRFDPDNVHGECISCNRFDDNHLIGYRQHLIAKIGLERFEMLKEIKSTPFKWERQYLLNIIEKYK